MGGGGSDGFVVTAMWGPSWPRWEVTERPMSCSVIGAFTGYVM